MCCLRYEHEFYVQSRKRFPKEGRAIRTKHGEEKVVANDIFRERVMLRSEEGELRTVSLEELHAEAASVGVPLSVSSARVSEPVTLEIEESIPDENDLVEPMVVVEAAPSEAPVVVELNGERKAHRRRGRRGGRRNRHGKGGSSREPDSEDSGDDGGGAPPASPPPPSK
jgi:hypothetical protein